VRNKTNVLTGASTSAYVNKKSSVKLKAPAGGLRGSDASNFVMQAHLSHLSNSAQKPISNKTVGLLASGVSAGPGPVPAANSKRPS